jgi:hypothetical protein
VNRVLSLAAVAGVILAGAAALAIADERGADGGSGQAADPAVARVAPQLPGLIAAFAREQTAADRLSPETVDWLTERADVEPGEAPALARRITLQNGASEGHLWPRRDGLCWSLTSGGGGCFPTELLATEGVLVANGYHPDESGDGTVYEIFALARSGIDKMSVTLANGDTVNLELAENAAHLVTRIEPITAHWMNVNGTAGSQPVSR